MSLNLDYAAHIGKILKCKNMQSTIFAFFYSFQNSFGVYVLLRDTGRASGTCDDEYWSGRSKR